MTCCIRDNMVLSYGGRDLSVRVHVCGQPGRALPAADAALIVGGMEIMLASFLLSVLTWKR